MSYDIEFEKDGKIVEFSEPHHLTGGTYQDGGCREAWLNITYNYSTHFQEVLGEQGVRGLYGKSAQECIPILECAIASLGTERDPNYWAATKGNAGAALADLLAIARACPSDAVCTGD